MSNYLFDNHSYFIEKFESMLKTNEVYFFDELEFFDIISYYTDLGNENLVNQALKLGLTQHPFSVELNLIKAEQLIAENHLDEANQILNDLPGFEPINEHVFILKASIYSKKFQHKKAIEMLQIGLKLTDKKDDLLFLIGMEYLYQEQYLEAEEYFTACLTLNSDDEQALSNLIFCCEIQGKYKLAEEYLLKYIEQNPYNKIAWFQLGKQYYEQKNYEEALKAFDYALLIDDTFLGGYIEKGKTFQRLERYAEAIECYLSSVELDDPSAFVFFVIGKCYELSSLNEKAIIYYKKALHEDPQFEKSWLALIQLNIKLNQLNEALMVVENALEIDDQNKSFIKNRKKILKNLNGNQL